MSNLLALQSAIIAKNNADIVLDYDFTAFVEVDPDNVITVNSATKVTVVDMQLLPTAYLAKNMGVDFFSGDFELEDEYTPTSAAEGVFVYTLTIANSLGGFGDIKSASGDLLTIRDSYNNLLSKRALQFIEMVGGTEYTSLSILLDEGVKYYRRFSRDESVGPNGTCYLEVFTDPERTVSIGSVNLALHAKKDFRYIYAVQSYGQFDIPPTLSFIIENLV